LRAKEMKELAEKLVEQGAKGNADEIAEKLLKYGSKADIENIPASAISHVDNLLKKTYKSQIFAQGTKELKALANKDGLKLVLKGATKKMTYGAIYGKNGFRKNFIKEMGYRTAVKAGAKTGVAALAFTAVAIGSTGEPEFVQSEK